MSKFKALDKVKSLWNCSTLSIKQDEIYTIACTNKEGSDIWLFNTNGWISDSYFELIESAKERPEFVIGSKVKFVRNYISQPSKLEGKSYIVEGIIYYGVAKEQFIKLNNISVSYPAACFDYVEECVCSITDLMWQGCKCGNIKRYAGAF
jgi:hypothetical protein